VLELLIWGYGECSSTEVEVFLWYGKRRSVAECVEMQVVFGMLGNR